MSEWLTKQSFQIDEATAERDALVLPSKSRGAEIRLSRVGFPVSFRSTLSEVRLLTRGPPREESSGPFSAHYRTLQR